MKFYTNPTDQTSVCLCKFLGVMRLIILLLIIGITQVSANTYAQQFTLKRDRISLKQIFREIKNQTGYDVLWQPEKLDGDKLINVYFNNATISQVVISCIKNQNLDFHIEDNTIVIKEKYTVMQVPQDSVNYTGEVLDEKGLPLPGATVRIKGSNRVVISSKLGNFVVYGSKKSFIQVSYLGYNTKEISLAGLDPKNKIIVSLSLGLNQLGEVNIVSTGYQDLPKERATGSFEVITKEQLQHSASPDLVRRLEGITTSLNFNNQLVSTYSASNSSNALVGLNAKSAISNLTIRGRNTLIQANTRNLQSGAVLVVIDGIASPYSIDMVNPNDVENITILKDAASASIWGSRAANGVIVIKTKRGGFSKPLNISINSSINILEKPNLFYKKYMSTSDFIDAQVFQFNASNTTIGQPDLFQAQRVASPVAEILNQQKLGQITPDQATLQLNNLRGNDVRNDLDKYILRNAVTQNYSLGIDGGTKGMAYRLSGSYDKALNNVIFSNQDRLTLNFNSTFRPLKNLEIQANITYSKARTSDLPSELAITGYIGGALYPYTQLADEQGNHLAIPYQYRQAFLDLLTSTYGTNLLSLQYKPLDDINQGYLKSNSQNINLNVGANYKLNSIFSLNIVYNYNRGYNEQNTLYRQGSFYMRNLIDLYTAGPNFEDPDFGPQPFRKNIPLGGLYNPIVVKSNNQTLRGLLSVNKTWNKKHTLSAIAGVDVAQTYSLTKNDKYYGYDEQQYVSNTQVNYADLFLTLFGDANTGPSYLRIPGSPTPFIDTRIRNFSVFSNAAYTYNNRYTLSASVRKDGSSEFGPGTNKGGTPYYSMGGSWNIANEGFYNLSWLPRLQLRTTFGYNGNVNAQVGAQPYITYPMNLGPNSLNFGNVSAEFATNKKLRPEKTAILNFGLDFGLRNNRLSGSLEYYDKKTTDLIASGQVDPSTGFSTLYFNTASMHGRGIDLTLNSQNLQRGLFNWTSNFLFSYNRVKVTHVYGTSAISAGTAIAGSPNYNEGSDLSRLFAYKWAGLDPVTGDPRGFDANGQPLTISSSAQGSTAYTLINNLPSSTARYFGSAVPVYYGSLRNTFSYGNFSLSASLLYKLGYYFRRPTSEVVSYTSLTDPITNSVQGIEYTQRWQKTGDELNTNVPSFTYPTSQFRDSFYYYSEINVLKADHIRLQEVNLSYSFGKKNWFLKSPRIYANVSNLGIIWRANKLGLDPDTNDYPIPRAYTMGLSANF